jgi:hypothetical protein
LRDPILENVKFLNYWESLEIDISNIRSRKRISGEALRGSWEPLGTLEANLLKDLI